MIKKLIGLGLIIGGAALAFWGYDIYDSASSQITRALSGDTPMEAWLGMGGGIVCIIIGALQLK